MMHRTPLSSDTTRMATLSPRSRVEVPDHVITRLVGGSTVILDVQSGRSFTLDAVGSRVWGLLESTGSVDETLAALAREFDADLADLQVDVLQLIEQLSAGGLLAIADPA